MGGLLRRMRLSGAQGSLARMSLTRRPRYSAGRLLLAVHPTMFARAMGNTPKPHSKSRRPSTQHGATAAKARSVECGSGTRMWRISGSWVCTRSSTGGTHRSMLTWRGCSRRLMTDSDVATDACTQS
ncbi:hypothetical protein BJX68DRAFT_246747 [Aspergillus pseudodeflectus]|uniref:Uncharacterized protein n=1 Tax=Aspergillus pseudodeflectus TaxID=176178 RepID=A0ABR4JN17_9EURO